MFVNPAVIAALEVIKIGFLIARATIPHPSISDLLITEFKYYLPFQSSKIKTYVGLSDSELMRRHGGPGNPGGSFEKIHSLSLSEYLEWPNTA